MLLYKVGTRKVPVALEKALPSSLVNHRAGRLRRSVLNWSLEHRCNPEMFAEYWERLCLIPEYQQHIKGRESFINTQWCSECFIRGVALIITLKGEALRGVFPGCLPRSPTLAEVAAESGGGGRPLTEPWRECWSGVGWGVRWVWWRRGQLLIEKRKQDGRRRVRMAHLLSHSPAARSAPSPACLQVGAEGGSSPGSRVVAEQLWKGTGDTGQWKHLCLGQSVCRRNLSSFSRTVVRRHVGLPGAGHVFPATHCPVPSSPRPFLTPYCTRSQHACCVLSLGTVVALAQPSQPGVHASPGSTVLTSFF